MSSLTRNAEPNAVCCSPAWEPFGNVRRSFSEEKTALARRKLSLATLKTAISTTLNTDV